MTASQTLPIPLRTTPLHEHAWLVESRHATSEGQVLYVRCSGCAARRVDLHTATTTPPQALSRTIAEE